MINLNNVKCIRNREFTDSDVNELAQSIGNIGLLQPIVLREIETDDNGCCYEVLAGRRRFEALMKLKRYEIDENDYRVIDSSDPELISFVENFERKNLTLVEEVAHLAALRETYSPSELAAFLGRTEKYIRIRLQLRNLTKQFSDALNEDKFPAVKIGHYEVISKYPASVQEQIFNSWRLQQPGSISNFENNLALDYSHILANAPFDIKECEKCLEHTGADPELFEEMKDKKQDRCLNPKCYEQRRVAAIKNELTEIKKDKLEITPVTTSYRNLPSGLGKVECLDRNEYDIVESDVPKERANAYVVDGEGTGTYCRITVRDGAGNDAPPKPKTMEEKRAELNNNRNKLALQKLHGYLDDEKNLPPCPYTETLLALAALNGIWNTDLEDEGIANRNKYTIDEIRLAVWKSLVGDFANSVKPPTYGGCDIADELALAIEVCDVCNLVWNNFVQEAAAELPEPKEWAEDESGKKTADPAAVPEPVKFEIANDMFVELNNIKKVKKHWECCYYAKVVEDSESAVIAGKTALEAVINAAQCALEFVQDCHPTDRLIEHSRLLEPLIEYFEKQKDTAGMPADIAKERKCRLCGCTEDMPCMTAQGPCSWVEKDLCSACADVQPKKTRKAKAAK